MYERIYYRSKRIKKKEEKYLSWKIHDIFIAKLKNGETIIRKVKGNSMTPLIKSGDSLTITYVNLNEIQKGDVVYCKVGGYIYCHLVTGIKTESCNLRFKISNNHGHDNGWTSTIYGKVMEVNGSKI